MSWSGVRWCFCHEWYVKRIQELARHAYFVQCPSHYLNLVLKDAVEGTQEISQFFETIQNIYNVFGHSIIRWQDLQMCAENSNTTLKTLNPTRWAGKYEAVYSLKEIFCDVMRSLSHIILTSKKLTERNEDIGLMEITNIINGFMLELNGVSFGEPVAEASERSGKWSVSNQFPNKRDKKTF